MISVYITCRDASEAKKIAKALLEKKLAACINTFPVESFFWWHDKVHQEHEVALLAKTRKEKFEKIKEEVKKLHSYDVPCIVAFEWAESSGDYASWVREQAG